MRRLWRPKQTTVVSDNLLWRNFKADAPNQKWTSDITYIWVDDQWLYLATVMDLYSRGIVGWALGYTMTEALIQQALDDALKRRQVEHESQGKLLG